MTLLLEAAKNGTAQEIRGLISNGWSPKTAGIDSNTPLHLAALFNNAEATPALLRAGAALEAQNSAVQTPLHCAARWGHLAAVLALIEAGAQLNARDSMGRTPLTWAASYGHVKVIEMLAQRGALIDIADSTGWTPLAEAVFQGKEAAARALLGWARVRRSVSRGPGRAKACYRLQRDAVGARLQHCCALSRWGT